MCTKCSPDTVDVVRQGEENPFDAVVLLCGFWDLRRWTVVPGGTAC